VDDLKLAAGKRDTALGAVRAYQDNVRRLTELTGSSLVLRMKEIVSPEEFKKLTEATNRFRSSRFNPRRPGLGPRPGVDDIVERLLSFDKNKDGKITRDELPERMQDLIAKGDTNKDGALDKEEIKKLAEDLARNDTDRGRGRGRGPGGPGGPGAAGGVPLRVIERAVEDLKLEGKKKETAGAAVKANQENVRKLTELARADLLLKMEEVLSEEEFKKFKAALERLPVDRPGREGPPRRFGPGRP
jgi:hypothetical protein